MERNALGSLTNLINQLSLIRENSGITIETTATRMGVDKAAVSRFERGLTNPTLRTISRYADAIDASLVLFALPNTNESKVEKSLSSMKEALDRLEHEEDVPSIIFGQE